MRVSVQQALVPTTGAGAQLPTLVDAIVDQAGGSGSLTLLDAGGEATELVSWRDLHGRAKRMSTVLGRAGVGPGDRVALSGETSADLVAALQAVWFTGAAVLMLPPVERRRTSDHTGGVHPVLADAGVTLVIDGGGSPGGSGPPVLSLADLARRAAGASAADAYRPDPGDLALLQYTSGSTRSPRGVPVTHRHLAANVRAIKAALDHEGSHPSRMLSWLPLYHDMGLIGFLCMPMSCGCDLILQPASAFARHPAGWLPAMARHRATMSGGPNFAYALMVRLLASDHWSNLDLSSVRCLVSGGEPIDPAMMARFAELGARHGLRPGVFTPAYGLAETTLAASISVGRGLRDDRVDAEALEVDGRAVPPAPGRPARVLARVGPPVPGTAIRIIDRRTGAPVGERTVGHIELRGPSVVGHYWPDPAPPPEHWLRTGDLGYLADRELVVCGRAKDVLFAAGRNIFPQDVEAVACEVPGVRAGGAAAFGLAGPTGERLMVVVETLSDDPESLQRSVAAAVRAELGLSPADVIAVRRGTLPRTTSGKLRRAETRQRYLAGEITGLTRKGTANGNHR